MASQTYEIAFKLAGQMAGNFANTFKSANDAVKGFGNQINELNRQASDIGKVVKLREQVARSAQAYIQAKQRVAELGAAMSNSANPTAKMRREHELAERAVTAAKQRLQQERAALQTLNTALGTSNTRTRDLVARQNELTRATERARKAQEGLQRTQARQEGAKTMRSEGMSGVMSVAATAAATMGAPIVQAMSFEDQTAELGKFSDEATAVFNGIKDLSLKYAKSTEDMTAMAANAFQSGIAKTKDEALKLVEIQNQMAIAFDMTGEEVGTAFADIQSKMGLTIGKSEKLFDIVNQIGNTTSASSKDIVEVLQRAGGAVKGLTALNEKQAAAMAGAFRSASVSPEVAATSMMSFTNSLTAGTGATKAQKDALNKLGFDAVKVAKQMTSTPEAAQKAVQDILASINKLPADQQSSVIGKLFGNEAGVKSAVATLAKQGGLLAGNFKIIGDEANYAGSMFKEYSARADTTSNALVLAKNAMKIVAGEAGTALLPAIRQLAGEFVKGSAVVIEWVKNNQGLVTTILKVTGVVFASLLAFNMAKIVIGGLLSPILGLVRVAQTLRMGWMLYRGALAAGTVATQGATVASYAFKAAQVALSGVMKLARLAMLGFNLVMAANPIALVVLAIAGLIAIGVALYQNWDTVKAKAVELWGAFSSKFPAMANVVRAQFAVVSSVAKNVWGVFTNLIGFVKNIFTGQWSAAWENVKGIFKNAFSALTTIAKAPINAVIAMVNKAISGINSFGSFKIPSVKLPGGGKIGGQSIGLNIPTIPHLASGGIVSSPTLAMVGEGGESEAVTPLSKLPSLLGAGAGNTTITFAPVIHVSGGSGDPYADVKRALEEAQREFEKRYKSMQENKQRLSFA